MNSALHQLQDELALSLRGLDATQTQLRPPSRPGKWSIQQIVEHLLLTYARTEAAINARLTKRTPTRATPSIPQRLGQYTLIHLGYFPTGRKAPPPVAPPPTTQPISGEDLAQATHDYLTQLDTLCTEAELLFGSSSRCASHMILGPLSLDQWRKFQLIHGEHHIKQILAIRRAHAI